ncbi:MAG: hypothetical protein WCJ63_01735 [Actinomycetes bacterium]
MSTKTQTRRRPKSRRSLTEFEEAFRAEVVRERHRLTALRRDSKQRTLRRRQEQTRRRGQFRFVGLIASMIGTAVLVTVVMLETLSWLLG